MKDKPIETYFRGIGASNHVDSERAEYDYYATDPKAIDCLLEKANPDKNIWECACGEGYLSKRLIELGYNVLSTDLVYRNFGKGGWTSCILTRCGMVISLRTHRINMLKSS